jgi:hypothetical protein
MPRVGGEADKLGNRFEGIWTVDALFEVLGGRYRALTLEPIRGGEGVEFYRHLPDGGKEYHSVKRQTTQAVWSTAQLTAPQGPNRTVLGDLLLKLHEDERHRAVFISSTTANELNEICEIADRAADRNDFIARLQAQPRLLAAVVERIGSVLPDPSLDWSFLRRTTVVGITERELIRRVGQTIRQTLHRLDGEPVREAQVRQSLADQAIEWIGRDITAAMVSEHLRNEGWHEQDWRRTSPIWTIVANRNQRYAAAVEAELILGAAIPRAEAAQAAECLTTGTHDVALVGAAGLGKSCALAQVAHAMAQSHVPHLVLRLDLQTGALTAEAFGREMGLPTSPVITLAGMAQGARSVLVIDQLDALSSASGRNQDFWTVFEELIAERRRYPQMRVLLACREFDANNDHRLKRLLSDEQRCRKIVLAPLSAAQVTEAVTRAGVDATRLTPREIELLQTPQNLSLYLQAAPAKHGSVGNAQALLNRYWDYKRQQVDRRLGRTVRWQEMLTTLTDWLSRHQSLSAPVDVLDPFGADVQAMASERVLVVEGSACRFFHESVFDYAFARIFVASGGTAARLLADDEQHLFRRAQVRQVLTYNRDRSFTEYLTDLRHLLNSPQVRTHIKKLVIDWLRTLPDPQPLEWQAVAACATVRPVAMWWQTVPHGSVAWFDLLMRLGVWSEWLKGPETERTSRALWLLSQSSLLRIRSDEVAALVESMLDTEPTAVRSVCEFLRFGELYHSRRMFNLLRRAVREGWLEDAAEDWWYHVHDFPARAPGMAAELLGAIFDRMCVLRPQEELFVSDDVRYHLPADYCTGLAQHGPREFLREMLPRLVREVIERRADKMVDRDWIWCHLRAGDVHDFGSVLLQSLGTAAVTLAQSEPTEWRVLAKSALGVENHSVAFVLLRGWTGNPSEYAEDCVNYISRHGSRLRVGYEISIGAGGYDPAYVSREAVRAVAPHCDDVTWNRLEAAILAYRNPWETGERFGFSQLLLLAALPPDRLGTNASARLDELRRKFPRARDARPLPIKVQRVESPIDLEVMPKMSDANWITAMRKYDHDRMSQRGGGLHGGMHELGSALQLQAQRDRPRYARLLLALPDDISPTYFDDLLRGLSGNERNDHTKEKFPLLDIPVLVAVIRRMHSLPGRPCGRAICYAISHSAERELPDELLTILEHYALNDPDPTAEDWLPRADGRPALWGGDPLMSGMNKVRGAAAWAIGSILFAQPETWPKLEPVVRALVADRSIAVRCCVVRCLLALLNFERGLAVDLFLRLIEGADAVLGAGEVDNFIHHGMFPHYARLQPVLRRMLLSSDREARTTAARQIAVGSLGEPERVEDLTAALSAGPECRAACATVFAANVGDPNWREVCRMQLRQMFHDEDKHVRVAAAGCFRELDGDRLGDEAVLIGDFLDSPSFMDQRTFLLAALEKSTSLLPDVICGIPEKIVARRSEDPTDRVVLRDVYRLPDLVLRLYRQTRDEAIRRRCLDIIDSMLEHSIGDIDSELNKVER